MPRFPKFTVTFDDGSTHVYNNAPDDVTPDQITARVAKEFKGKTVSALDGGRKPAAPTAGRGEGFQDPRLIGSNALALRDANGKEFIRDMLNRVKDKEQAEIDRLIAHNRFLAGQVEILRAERDTARLATGR